MKNTSKFASSVGVTEPTVAAVSVIWMGLGTVPPGPKLAVLRSFARVFVIWEPSSVQFVGNRDATTLPTRRVCATTCAPAHIAASTITSLMPILTMEPP